MVFLRPDADAVDGNWLNQAGNNTNLYASLNEVTASDAEYIQSPVNPSNEVCKVGVGDPPGGLAEPFVVRYRFNNSGGASLLVRLMQGTTEIASWTETGSGWTTQARTLSTAQFNAITDPTDLFVELKADSGADLTKTLDIDFTLGTLDSKITFTRNSSGTYFDSSGVLQIAATDVARFDYHPTTHAARGLLIEEQRTNSLPQSADVGAPPWASNTTGSGSISRTANSGVAPDGTTTAALITINRSSASDWAEYYQGLTGAPNPAFGSLYLKAFAAGDIGKTVTLGMYGAPITSVQHTLTADWVRVLNGPVTTGPSQFDIGYMGGVGAQTGQVQFYAWGAQLEDGAFATSLVPTTSTAVTRAADLATITGTNFSSWFSPSVGTFVAAFDGPADGTRPIISADDNTANERIFLYGSGTDPMAVVTDGGTAQASLDLGTLAANTPSNIAMAFTLNDIAGCFNGGTVGTDTSATLPAPDRLRIGSGAVGNMLTGHVSRVTFYNTRKTNAELQALTA